MEAISPELALVDQRLGSATRHTLPDTQDCLTRLQRVSPATAGQSGGRPRAVAGAAIACILAAAFLLAGGGVRFDNSPGARSTMGAVASDATEASTPAELRWKPVRNAVFYNVILWHGGVRALDLWPTTPAAQIPQGKLASGTYEWFVYPAFAKEGSHRYGRVIAHGRLRL